MFLHAVSLGASLLAFAAVASSQTADPALTRPQRAALETLVAAVDAAATAPATVDVDWQLHLLRASDGSHYVAFTISAPAAQLPQQPAILYVRLATRRPLAVTAERSAVMEWLKGKRTDPRLVGGRRGIAFGEMPVYGAGSIAARGAANAAQDLKLLEFERERARAQREAAERHRKEELEGDNPRSGRNLLLPFEDFDLRAEPVVDGDRLLIRRSLTAGPGEYDLVVAWAPHSDGKPAPPHIVKRQLNLPTASTSEFALSTVILADQVSMRDVPHPSDKQTAHPYAFGVMEITPARDDVFTNEEQLKLVFQIVNPKPATTGKPDVSVNFQLFRVTSQGEQSAGSLQSQVYGDATLPPDFDLAKGHPVFAAIGAPLSTLARGTYRLRVAASDRLSGRSAIAETSFRIAATPRTLLRATPFGVPFRSDSVLRAAVVEAVVNRLRPSVASAGLTKGLEAADQRRFLDLLRDEPVNPDEKAAHIALRGIGLFALGEARLSATLLTQALQLSASPAVHVFLGAARALEGNDRDAIVSWQTALDRGVDLGLVAPFLIDAHLRQGNLAGAGELLNAARAAAPTDSLLTRAAAALLVAQGQEGEAAALMEARLSRHADDVDAQFVLLHALFAGFVHNRGPGSSADGQAQFRALARGYVDAKHPRASLVAEWMEVMPRD